jgi:HNH endonuclease
MAGGMWQVAGGRWHLVGGMWAAALAPWPARRRWELGRHYIAYRKVEEWGPVVETGPEFTHWTAKRRGDVEKTLGQNIWVISGERMGGKMTYKLCHVFAPEEIIHSGAGHVLRGKGTGFVPHADVTGESWFGKLLDEQDRFSFGVNEIKDRSIIGALVAFMGPASLADAPEEIARPQMYSEGATKPVMVNAYERDPGARAACIAHYGARCQVCGFDFEAQYGEPGSGVMDVHHLKPLAEVGPGYRADPIKDLRPVCPNCHTIIHKGTAPLSMAEAKALVRKKYGD